MVIPGHLSIQPKSHQIGKAIAEGGGIKADCRKQDLKNPEFHLLDTSHFALEEDGQQIVEMIRQFMKKNVV